ncbi:MAG: DUF2490 domain-containing protein [Catalinimonas sp.]
MFRVLAATALLFAFSLHASAQQAARGNWFVYCGKAQLAPRRHLHHEVQYRTARTTRHLRQLLLRTGVGYDLGAGNEAPLRWSALAGYAYLGSRRFEPDAEREVVRSREHRVYQELTARHRFGRFSLRHRGRFEQRFFDDAFRLRYRYSLAVKVALSKPQMQDHTLYAAASNEVFVQSGEQHFDHNRVYGGLGYCLSKHLRAELRYLVQMLTRGHRDQTTFLLVCSF